MNEKLSILIVEDEILTASFIKSGLEKYGFKNIYYCLSSKDALHRVEESKPDLALLDISLEDKYSGIELARTFTVSYQIPVIYVTGGIDDQTIEKIEETEPYGLIFKPFRIQTLKVLINIAVKRMTAEHNKLESERKLEISKTKLLDQVRELDTFFKVSQLVNKRVSIEELIKDALPLIPAAFNLSDSICTRITYRSTVYESEGFKESKWVLSESLSKNYKTGDMIELYLILDENLESFPFSIDDINTFSAITQQLSLALQRFSFEADLNKQLKLREMLNSILQHLLTTSDEKLSSILQEMLRHIGEYFYSDFCQIIFWNEKEGRKTSNRTSWSSGKTLSIKHPSENVLLDFRQIKNSCYLNSLSNSDIPLGKPSLEYLNSISNYSFLVIPVNNNNRQVGIIGILINNDHTHLNSNTSSYDIIGDIVAMAVAKNIRERKIRVYKQAIEQNPSTIVITDLEGRINYVNPMFTKTSGYTAEEVIGQNPRILKSGSQDKAFYEELWSTLIRGEVWKGTFHNKCKNGQLVWELAVLSPIKDSTGAVTGYIAIKEDISDKVEAEENLIKLNSDLVNTQASLVQEEKLASIGRLAAGVAHEINNPIGFVYSNFRTIGKYKENFQAMIETLTSNNSLDQEYLTNLFSEHKIKFILEDMNELLKESYDGFDRVINIVNSLRSFSRVDQLKSVIIYDLNEAIRTTLIIARNEIKYIAEIKTEFGEIPKTMCNSSEINQVILNLLVNAAQAIKSFKNDKKGIIYVRTYKEENYICCDIKDSGTGIPEDIIGNIFEPFFTTKPVGEGTGLGLNISYDIIVKKHDGQLFARNDEKNGAIFTFKLPIKKRMKGYLSMSNITILLVDDEISILRALKRTLFEYPFKIIIASSPMEAKEKMADNIIDMIISDYKMPVESGFQLLSFVRDTYPDVIRIMLSGYVEKEVILEALFSCAALTCFPKPWNDEKLLARISELLELKQKFNNPVLWKLINSGSLFSIELPVIQKLEKVNLVINDNEEMTRIISDNMFLLFRVARMVSSDYFNDSSEFNLTKAISIISSDSILKLSSSIPKSAFSKPDLYTIMPEIFLSHYDSLFHSMYGSSKPEPLSVYLPFIYIYNYLLFRIDRELYNNRIKAFIADGIPLNSSDRVQVIFKTILRLCGLPEKFMEYCDKVEFDETPEVLTAKKLRDLIELFWWSDSMPEKHSLYTIPSKILDNIYNAVQNFKKLQL